MCVTRTAFLCAFLFILACSKQHAIGQSTVVGVKKIKDVIIYEDKAFYAAFPSVIKMEKGELLLAFRRAPDRRSFGEKHLSHTDPNSYLVSVKSKDGEHWTKEPELIFAHPQGGSQDPCLLQLKDGTILCTSYAWGFQKAEGRVALKYPQHTTVTGDAAMPATFLGGYLLRSLDKGKTWQGPIRPPHIKPEVNYDAFNEPIRAYNRGALVEGRNGAVYWVVAATDDSGTGKTSNYLLRSDDKGFTWQYLSEVAKDYKVYFNEASIYETPKGDLVAFLRTEAFQEQAAIARSTDGGKTFQPWESMGFEGRPLNALRLPDNRVLLTYGFRNKPYGIRARILNAECTDYKTAPEIILRDDGGNSDIGYSWPVQLDKHRVLVVYYFNRDNGPRHIAGTILQIDPQKK
jgi:sialidase-1